MSESLFETKDQAVNYLRELHAEIGALPTDWDRKDFLGMYACHDAKIMWFVQSTTEAITLLGIDALSELGDVGKSLHEYTEVLDHVLSLALVSRAGEEASDYAWDWRLNSIMMVGGLNILIRKKWQINVPTQTN